MKIVITHEIETIGERQCATYCQYFEAPARCALFTTHLFPLPGCIGVDGLVLRTPECMEAEQKSMGKGETDAKS
jgi:hypothetical protein